MGQLNYEKLPSVDEVLDVIKGANKNIAKLKLDLEKGCRALSTTLEDESFDVTDIATCTAIRVITEAWGHINKVAWLRDQAQTLLKRVT